MRCPQGVGRAIAAGGAERRCESVAAKYGGGPLAVFDAALPGTEARADELLLVEIEPAVYRLRTADIESDTGTCARVHKFDRLIR
ncbi:Imm21 family immunity protein [Streptomyces sp. NPDC054802]